MNKTILLIELVNNNHYQLINIDINSHIINRLINLFVI